MVKSMQLKRIGVLFLCYAILINNMFFCTMPEAFADVPVTGISFSASEYTVLKNENVTLQVIISPTDATNQSVTFSSNCPEAASVGESTGIVTGVNPGIATITATTADGRKTATCTVYVLDNVALGKTASASNVYQAPSTTYAPSKAVDGSTSTYWMMNWLSGAAYYFQVDLENPYALYQLEIVIRPVANTSEKKDFEVRASNDANFSSYTVLWSDTSGNVVIDANNSTGIRNINNHTAFRYVRVIHPTVAGNHSIAELRLYGKPTVMPTTVYVSPSGNDNTGNGTLSQPFQTIQKARKFVNTYKAYVAEDITVYLRGGLYDQTSTLTFSQSDAGVYGRKIIYRAYSGEEPVIHGGKKITNWVQQTGSNLWTASNIGVDTIRQFYVNQERRQRARTEDKVHANRFYFTVTPSPTANSVNPEGWVVNSDALGTYSNVQDMEIHMPVQWRDTFLSVSEISSISTGEKKILSTLTNAAYQLNPMSATLSANGAFYLENALELLDQPGEWYYDRNTQVLYYYPKAGENPSTMEAYVPIVERLVDIRGTSASSKVNGIEFDGITFYYGTWKAPRTNGWFGYQSEFITSGGTFSGDPTNVTPSQITLTNATEISFTGCKFRHLGSAGVGMYKNVDHITFTGNVFEDISDAAIIIGSANQQDVNVPLSEICNNIDIQNNIFHEAGQEFYGAPGISGFAAYNVTIAHNEISGMPYSGIALGWFQPTTTASPSATPYPDHLYSNQVLNNKIESAMLKNYDGGCIYMIGHQQNSTIQGNYLKNQQNDHGAVYLDRSSAYWQVVGNVIENAPKWFFNNTTNNHDIYVDGNYANTTAYKNDCAVTPPPPATPYPYNLSVTVTANNPTSTASPYYVADANWPEGAQSIIQNAGLQEEFQGLRQEIWGSAANTAPTVDAGLGATILLTDTYQLSGTVSDDQLPSHYTGLKWTKVSGPGSVTFERSTSLASKATFSQAGTYVLNLEATDGALKSSDTVTIVVNNVVLPINLASGKPTYANNYYTVPGGTPNPNYGSDKLVDQNLNTSWVSTYPDGVMSVPAYAYAQVDLENAVKIGRIELYSRNNPYDFDSYRQNFVVQLANTADFSDAVTVGWQGDSPYEKGGVFVIHPETSDTYRYVRIQKSEVDAEGFSEIKVYEDTWSLATNKVDIKNVSLVDGSSAEATVLANRYVNQSNIIFALYDKNSEQFKEAKMFPNERLMANEAVQYETVFGKKGNMLKVYVWDDIAMLKPLAVSGTYVN